MDSEINSLSLSRLVSAAVVTAFTVMLLNLACPDDSSAGEAKLNILFISSYFKNVPAQVDFESGMDEVLEYSRGRHNMYFEFMDTPRVDTGNFVSIYGDYLQNKYEGIQFDVVMAWAATAITFLRNDETFFPSAHRIYVEDIAPETAERPFDNHSTSLDVREDWDASLAEVLRLEQPESIYVIGTTEDESGKSRIRHFKSSIKDASFRGKVYYLLDLPLDRVAETLEKLPRKDAVAVYLLMFSDGHGTNMTPYRIAEYLNSRSAVPIYSNWESLIGSGIVGGNLVSLVEAGKQAAEIILSPNTAKPVVSVVPMRNVYDWTALQRWGISEDKLPPGAVVVNRPPDLLSKYQWQIMGGVAVILGLALFSLFMARTLKLRNVAVDALAAERKNLARTVEERTHELVKSNRDLSDSEERFRNLSDAAFEGIVFIENGEVIDANTTCGEIFGYPVSEMINRPVLDFIAADEQQKVRTNIGSGYEYPYETKGLRKDGSVFPMQIHGKTFFYKGRSVRVTAVRDLTELKKSEEEIKILRGIIPICASCKKIRDDQGYWNQIDKYIHEHSEAEFSHGICPECRKRLYPDLDL